MLIQILGSTSDSACPDRCRCKVDKDIDQYTVDCHGLRLTTFPQSIPYSTTELLLNENRIKNLDAMFFEQHHRIETLDVSNNVIEKCASGIFKSLTNLRILNLGGNKIQTFANDSFQGLGNLEVLHIEYNRLSGGASYGILVFQPLTNLTDLFLECNCIKDTRGTCSYPDEALSYVTSLKRLTLDGSEQLGPGIASLNLTLLSFDGYCSLTHITKDYLRYINKWSLTHFWNTCALKTVEAGLMSLFPQSNRPAFSFKWIFPVFANQVLLTLLRDSKIQKWSL